MPENAHTDRVEELAKRVDDLESQLEDEDQSAGSRPSRRGFLGMLAASAGLGAAGVYGMTGSSEAATANGYVKTGEIRDGNDATLATLNNGGPFAFQVPVTAPSVETGKASINQFSQGFTHTIYRDTDDIYVLDRTGEVVYGGPSAIGVSDSEDFGEILQTVVNNNDRPAIRIGPRANGSGNSEDTFRFKTQASVDKAFSLFGVGKNRTNIDLADSMDSSTPLTTAGSVSGFICRFDSVKFTSIRNSGATPTRWVDFDGMPEVIISDVEFRDAGTEGIRAINNDGPTYIRDSWFLANSGFTFGGSADIVLTGNRILDGSTIQNYDDAVVHGNNGQQRISFSSVGEIDRSRRHETGRESATGPSASSTDDFSDASLKDVSVTFDSAFNSQPRVLHNQSENPDITHRVKDATATGFTWRMVNHSATNRSGTTFSLDWVAVEQ
jgi:hypothetical protein